MCLFSAYQLSETALSSTEFGSRWLDKYQDVLSKIFHVNKYIARINMILTLTHLNKNRILNKKHIKYSLVSFLSVIKQKSIKIHLAGTVPMYTDQKLAPAWLVLENTKIRRQGFYPEEMWWVPSCASFQHGFTFDTKLLRSNFLLFPTVQIDFWRFYFWQLTFYFLHRVSAHLLFDNFWLWAVLKAANARHPVLLELTELTWVIK